MLLVFGCWSSGSVLLLEFHTLAWPLADVAHVLYFETAYMLITHILSEFLTNSFPGWQPGGIHLELKEKTLRIVCESVETQRQICGDSSTLSRLDIGVDLFLVCCTGHPSFGIHRCHHC
jgi:hypothetical protein